MEKPFVFVHISDIHLQKRSYDNSYLNFRHFVNDLLPVINPQVVINTGDITQSQEYDRKKILDHDEWELYSTVLKEGGWFDERKWLDIRGNHDTFVHYEGLHPYKQHTVYGSFGKGSVYSTVYKVGSGYLRFIGIDANGPLYRHFNGFLTRDILDALEELLHTSEFPTILFSHYPIFTMDHRARSSLHHSFSDLLQLYKPLYYLCGHMHSALGGLISRFHTTIEAEQFDFKHARQFRIYSYFNSQLSFTTYNINIDESPIIIIHSPVDIRYERDGDRSHSNLIYFTVVNVRNPQIQLFVLSLVISRFVDMLDFSLDPGLAIQYEENQTHVQFRPVLKPGNHEFRCYVTNGKTNKTTVAQRAFRVYATDSDGVSGLNGNESFKPLSHVLLEQSLPSSLKHQHVEYALEYPTSAKVNLITHIDWSKAMMYLNPLILFIILFIYWLCRKIGFHVLQKQTTKTIAETIDFSSWDWFFATDRSMKYSLFNSHFETYPSWLRWVLARLFLFTTDNLVFYGVIAVILCRNFLPRYYSDDINNPCIFSIFGYTNFVTKEHYPYMDTYVFGAAFFYVMMILFTVYMFLFAAPSSYKLCSYNILSYLLMIVDVILMVQFYKLSINGKRRKNMRSLLSLLLQLTDSFSLVILLVLMIREKMILPLCYKNPHLIVV